MVKLMLLHNRVMIPVSKSLCNPWFWASERWPDNSQHCVEEKEGAEAERTHTQ